MRETDSAINPTGLRWHLLGKGRDMRHILAYSTILLALLLSSCEVSDPGSPLPEVGPTTEITSAPQSGTTVNHYQTLRWKGNDSDGEVVGFNMYIDGNLVAYTERTDSTISFASPSSGEAVPHTFSVQSVDDDGNMDATPPAVQFQTINTAPTCLFSSSNTVLPNSNVGQGFQIKLESEDSNRSGIEFVVSIDDTTSWSAWSDDSVFVFADLALGELPAGTVVISNLELTEGQHTIHARCRDSGFALSPVISRTVNVVLGNRPVMGVVSARYNSGSASDSLYPDGSIFRRNNSEMIISFSAAATSYRGLIHSYRVARGGNDWSDWQELPELTETDLPLGAHEYKFIARDVAGAISDTATFFATLVQQQLSDSVLVVDETLNGSGAPTLPTDAQVDEFYAALVEGYKVRNVDLTERLPNAYVTPLDVSNIGLVIWHAEDRTEQLLDDNRRILSEFMQRGGRVIFSGRDLFNAFSLDSEIEFAESDFGYSYMRAFSGHRDPGANPNLGAEGTGFVGYNGYPSVQIDPTKVLPNWQGSITRVWTFVPRGECQVIGRLTTRTEGYLLENEVVAYVYDLSFRAAVFGIPLYFCNQSQVEELFDVLMPRMLAGLGS